MIMEEYSFSYRKTYTVPTGTEGTRLLPFLLSCMEQTAKEDAIRLGQGTDVLMARYHSAWMILRTQLQVLAPIHAGMKFEIFTWSRGVCGASVLRDFHVFADGREVVRATQLWIVADLTTRRLRNPRSMPELDTPCPPFAFSTTVPRFDLIPAKTLCAELTVGAEDIDENGHMNNVRYVTHAVPYLPQFPYPCSIQLEYCAELLQGQSYQCFSGQEDNAVCLVFRIGEKDHFRMLLQPLDA